MNNTEQYINKLTASRDKLRDKAVELGIADSAAKLETLAEAYDGIEDRGAVSVEIKEDETYTVPKGYHDGAGTVTGIAGGGNYKLQPKEVTPTKSQQPVTPDDGYYGLESVTVKAIPTNYQDVSDVDVTAGDMIEGKVAVGAGGSKIVGTIADKGELNATIDGIKQESYAIEPGYYSGGKVKLDDTIANMLAEI